MTIPNIKLEVVSIALEVVLLSAIFMGCNSNRQNATLGNSQDTTSVTRAGGPPIKDTGTISAERKAEAAKSTRDTTAKGNADPTGHANKK